MESFPYINPLLLTYNGSGVRNMEDVIAQPNQGVDMDLQFELGNSEKPRGHALVYFNDTSSGACLASYVVLLPITVDVSKYVPPFLMNQVGEIGPGDMSVFAFPPAPEEVEDLEFLIALAETRQDDLIYGGEYAASDVTSAMMKVNDVVQAYLELYEDETGFVEGESKVPIPEKTDYQVNDIMYSMMSEADKLGELTKLVGRMRYAIESDEETLVDETEADLTALSSYLPDTFQLPILIEWACKEGQRASDIANLYLRRCYHLSLEEYEDLGKVEEQIKALDD